MFDKKPSSWAHFWGVFFNFRRIFFLFSLNFFWKICKSQSTWKHKMGKQKMGYGKYATTHTIFYLLILKGAIWYYVSSFEGRACVFLRNIKAQQLNIIFLNHEKLISFREKQQLTNLRILDLFKPLTTTPRREKITKKMLFKTLLHLIIIGIVYRYRNGYVRKMNIFIQWSICTLNKLLCGNGAHNMLELSTA